MGGGLMQLVNAYGAPDNFLFAHCVDEPPPSNTRDSIMHWFVGRRDGFARTCDISATDRTIPAKYDDEDASGFFSHALQHQQPSKDVTQPRHVRSDTPSPAAAAAAQDALAALVAQRAAASADALAAMAAKVDAYVASLCGGHWPGLALHRLESAA
jgi:hypothetical protein